MKNDKFNLKIQELWQDYLKNHCSNIDDIKDRVMKSFNEKNKEYQKNNPPKDKSVFFDPELEAGIEKEFVERVFESWKRQAFLDFIKDCLPLTM